MFKSTKSFWGAEKIILHFLKSFSHSLKKQNIIEAEVWAVKQTKKWIFKIISFWENWRENVSKY